MKRDRVTMSVDLIAMQRQQKWFADDVEIFYEINYLDANDKHAVMNISLDALQKIIAYGEELELAQQKKP